MVERASRDQLIDQIMSALRLAKLHTAECPWGAWTEAQRGSGMYFYPPAADECTCLWMQ